MKIKDSPQVTSCWLFFKQIRIVCLADSLYRLLILMRMLTIKGIGIYVCTQVLKPSTITLCLSNARLFGATCLKKKKLLALSVFRRPMKPLIFFVWFSLAL